MALAMMGQQVVRALAAGYCLLDQHFHRLIPQDMDGALYQLTEARKSHRLDIAHCPRCEWKWNDHGATRNFEHLCSSGKDSIVKGTCGSCGSTSKTPRLPASELRELRKSREVSAKVWWQSFAQCPTWMSHLRRQPECPPCLAFECGNLQLPEGVAVGGADGEGCSIEGLLSVS